MSGRRLPSPAALATLLVASTMVGCGDDSSGGGETVASVTTVKTVTETSAQTAESAPDAPSKPEGEDEGSPSAPGDQAPEPPGFTSPTGNIGCIINRRTVRCGQSISVGLLNCDSEEFGVTCRDAETGRGFTIAKEAYQIF